MIDTRITLYAKDEMTDETQRLLHSPSKINKMFNDAQAHFELVAKQMKKEASLKKQKQDGEEKDKANEGDVEMATGEKGTKKKNVLELIMEKTEVKPKKKDDEKEEGEPNAKRSKSSGEISLNNDGPEEVITAQLFYHCVRMTTSRD